MLDRLGVGDDRGIEHGLVLDLAGGLVGFLDQSVDRRAIRSLRLLAELGKYLVEALDLIFGIDDMRLEAGFLIRVGGHVRHFRNGLGELLLGIIDVFQLMEEKVFHRFDVFCENSHLSFSFVRPSNR
jgi:hypothetical protein